jgi:hypothetical protein
MLFGQRSWEMGRAGAQGFLDPKRKKNRADTGYRRLKVKEVCLVFERGPVGMVPDYRRVLAKLAVIQESISQPDLFKKE